MTAATKTKPQSQAPLGKKDLLEWASQHSGVPCTKYDDLKDGVVFLSLFDHLFPETLNPSVIKNQLRGATDVQRNWELLRVAMERKGLPTHLCDRRAIAAGRPRHCFNMLVLFYFLTKLASSSDFSVDFESAIDQGIAEFLQSPQSLTCVGKVPSNSDALPSSSSSPSSLQPPRRTRTGSNGGRAARPSSRSNLRNSSGSSSRAASRPDRFPYGTHADQSTDANHPVRSLDEALQSEEGGHAASKPLSVEPQQPAISRSSRAGPPLHPPLVHVKSLLTESDANVAVADDGAAQRTNRQLLEELEHVKAAAKLHQAQQRAMVESELTRVSQRFQNQFVALRLEKDYEVKRYLQELRASHDELLATLKRDISSCGSGHADAATNARNETGFGDNNEHNPLVRILRGKIAALQDEVVYSDRVIEQLRDSLRVQSEQTETLCNKLQVTCNALVGKELQLLLEDSARKRSQQGDAGNNAGESNAAHPLEAHDQETSLTSMMAIRIAGLEHELHALKWENERLQDTVKQQHVQLAGSASDAAGSQRNATAQIDFHGTVTGIAGVIAPSPLIDGQRCDELCDELLEKVERVSWDESASRDAMLRMRGYVTILQQRLLMASSGILRLREEVRDAHGELLAQRQQDETRVLETERRCERSLAEMQFAEREHSAERQVMRRMREEESRRVNDAVAAVVEQVRQLAAALADGRPNAPSSALESLVRDAAEAVRDAWAGTEVGRNVAEEQMKALVATRKDLYASQLSLKQAEDVKTECLLQAARAEKERQQVEADLRACKSILEAERDATRRCIRELESKVIAVSGLTSARMTQEKQQQETPRFAERVDPAAMDREESQRVGGGTRSGASVLGERSVNVPPPPPPSHIMQAFMKQPSPHTTPRFETHTIPSMKDANTTHRPAAERTVMFVDTPTQPSRASQQNVPESPSSATSLFSAEELERRKLAILSKYQLK